MLKRSIIYLGLYAVLGSSVAIAEYEISPKEAFERASTEKGVVILDVRSGQEWKWVGHPGPNGLADSKGEGLSYSSGSNLEEKVFNIAFKVDNGVGGLTKNESFVGDVVEKFNVNDHTMLLLCRSGTRAEPAAALLRSLGYTALWIEHGFQGDKNDETKPGPDTLYRDVNGWVNSKLPYNGDPAGAYYPKH